MQREPSSRRRALPLVVARLAAARFVCAVALAVGISPALAEAPRSAPAAPAPAREEGVRWQALTPAQREALAPLERDWAGIDASRKQKWIALAGRFRTLAPEERARITARMDEWAKLTPLERGQARLRFEEARQLAQPDRRERWQAYQALPPEKRQQLAARAASAASAPHDAASKPARVAPGSKEAKANLVPNPALAQAPRAVTPTLVQAAPGATTTVITRRPAPPPHQQSGMPKIATTPEFVNRATLLPRRGPQAAAVRSAAASRPVTPAAPPVPAVPALAPATPTAAPTAPAPPIPAASAAAAAR